MVTQDGWQPAFEELVVAIDGQPIMTVHQGRRIWEHFLEHEPVDVLDIGTCFGASAAYMGGALRHLGRGQVVTVDTSKFDDLSPAKDMVYALLERCGLQEWVRPVRMPHSSYAWWLLEEVQRHSDQAGACSPAYDFIYIDGAKSLTIDTTSVMLAEKLLRPGGWLLLDDLDWSYQLRPEYRPTTVLENGERFELSEAEIATPHLLAMFDALVRDHPRFDNLRIDADGEWGWAQKTTASGPRELTIRTELVSDVGGRALLQAAARKGLLRSKESVQALRARRGRSGA